MNSGLESWQELEDETELGCELGVVLRKSLQGITMKKKELSFKNVETTLTEETSKA